MKKYILTIVVVLGLTASISAQATELTLSNAHLIFVPLIGHCGRLILHTKNYYRLTTPLPKYIREMK